MNDEQPATPAANAVPSEPSGHRYRITSADGIIEEGVWPDAVNFKDAIEVRSAVSRFFGRRALHLLEDDVTFTANIRAVACPNATVEWMAAYNAGQRPLPVTDRDELIAGARKIRATATDDGQHGTALSCLMFEAQLRGLTP